MVSRKQFIATTALGVSAAALVSSTAAHAAEVKRAALHFHVLKPDEFDNAAMSKIFTQTTANKQVFQSVEMAEVAPGIASLYIHMQNALNAYEFSYNMGAGSLAVLAVLIGPSIVLALNDAMWKKYHIGTALKLPSATNSYYIASSNLDLSASPDDPNGVYQDWSAQALLKRGASFMVCHNATTAVAGLLAAGMGLNAASVLSDFEHNLLPGFLMVPAGVAAVQAAQTNGWKLFPII
jgi:intracellular sulfur oxidation DsrE/DsrF family protein